MSSHIVKQSLATSKTIGSTSKVTSKAIKQVTVTPSTEAGATAAAKNKYMSASLMSPIGADFDRATNDGPDVPHFGKSATKKKVSSQVRPKSNIGSRTTKKARHSISNVDDLSYANSNTFGSNIRGQAHFGAPRSNAQMFKTVVASEKDGPRTRSMAKSKSSNALNNRRNTAKTSKLSTRDLWKTSDTQGPGSYADERKFGDDSISYTIQKKRPEILQSSAGPGEYKHENGDSQTKHRSPSATIDKATARASLISKDTASMQGPGTYKESHGFGEEVPGFTIQQKREKTPPKTPGPGEYEPERSNSHTRHRSPGAIIQGSPARPDTFAHHSQVGTAGPGQYNSSKNFGKETKNMTIQVKRQSKIERTKGPGDYDLDRGMSATKSKSPMAKIARSSRPDNFTSRVSESHMGPGAYKKTGKTFGEDVKSFKIQGKHETVIQKSAGPGEYREETAMKHTKVRSKSALIFKAKRPDHFKPKESSMGPGAYSGHTAVTEFGRQTKKMTIGAKRAQRIEVTKGPGDYEHTRAEKLTRTSSPMNKLSKSSARPSSFAHKEQSGSQGPGAYEVHKRFGKDNNKTYTMGRKRDQKTERTAGPGQYDHERAVSITKSKTPNIDMGRSPARPSSFAVQGTGDHTAPGQYDDGIRFNSSIKPFKIGEKREKSIPKTAGPGEYNHERADNLTKTKTYNIDMGRSPARPSSFAVQGTADHAAPGQYNDGLNFNSKKDFTIGVKREREIQKTAGPGEYQHERAEALTKSKIVNIDMGKSPSRPQSFAVAGTADHAAPGQYEDGVRFNTGVKTFTIGEKREKQIVRTAGPGEYSPERGDTITKQKIANIDMGRSPARPASFAAAGTADHAAPGQYDDGIRFNSKKDFTIGVKRDKEIQKTAGPGEYNHERAEALTKTKTYNIDMGRSPARPQSFAVAGTADHAAPGQYDDGVRFNTGVKTFTIGEKREKAIVKTAGPGEYSPERGDTITKQKIANIDMGRSPARPASFAAAGTADHAAPGQYDDGIRFNTGIKTFTIGEKREKAIVKTAGPGEYSPERAEALTKTKTYNIDMGRSPARPQSFAVAGTADHAAPGQYDDGVRFNTGVKTFTIGEKREKAIPKSAGPGEYSPERADALTKQKTYNIDMGRSPSRPESFAVAGTADHAAPGQYDDGVRFNTGIKTFTIGEKREKQIERTAGPGEYHHERAEALTKTKTYNIDMGRSPARPQSFAVAGTADHAAPGQYDDGKRFNSDVKSFKIGEKRDKAIPKTAGPGEYSPERAEALTKQKTYNIDMGRSPARPASFAVAGTVDHAAPGQYDDGIRFNTGIKTFTIGEKREKAIPKTAGPGEYSPERAETITKQKTYNIDMGRSPARPTSFAVAGTADHTAPGQYDDGMRFNSGVKTFTIGEKRERQIVRTAGPGEYNHERAEALTKQKTYNIDMGRSPSRPESFANAGTADHTAPGQYDDGVRFNTGIKTFTIGEKRDKAIPKTAGPGEYSPERADTLIKAKTANIDMGRSPARPESFAVAGTTDHAAPGQYDDGVRWNTGVKTFTIGEKREQQIVRTAGPGEYQHERAEALTKSKVANIDMGRSPSRPESFAVAGTADHTAPGQYDDGVRFNTGIKTFTIGEKREKQITRTAGPGEYDHERAESLTKAKTYNIDMGRSPARPESFAVAGAQDHAAPGQYEDGVRFNTGVKSFTIGEKREQVIVRSAGPGEYSPERAESLTKQKVANIDMGRSPSRPESFAVAGTTDHTAPGQYDDGVRWNSGVKTFTIGEKREKKIERTAGPGEYDHEMADRQTRNRSPDIDMGRSPSRPESFAVAGTADHTAPGQYDDRNYEFGSATKSFTIGERRQLPTDNYPGPGEYAHERADAMTKTKSANIDLGKSPSRPASFAVAGTADHTAPGQYDDRHYEWGHDTKGFTIGERRQLVTDKTPGPGEYNHEKAESLTRTRSPEVQFGEERNTFALSAKKRASDLSQSRTSMQITSSKKTKQASMSGNSTAKKSKKVTTTANGVTTTVRNSMTVSSSKQMAASDQVVFKNLKPKKTTTITEPVRMSQTTLQQRRAFKF